MLVKLPTFEDGYGFSCCICGVAEAADVALRRRRSHIIKYDTPQGDVFLRAWITDTRDALRIEWAKATSFVTEAPPKVTTQKMEDVSRIIESAYDGLSPENSAIDDVRISL